MAGKLSDLGETVYPSPTGRRHNRIGLTAFKRCRQCGFANDTNVTAFSREGQGITDPDLSKNGDQTVTAGCAFCGSLYWQPSKPQKWPDDTFLVNPDLNNEKPEQAV